LGWPIIAIIMVVGITCQQRNIFPDTLLDYTLNQIYSDNLARETVDKLHLQPISPDINHIAYYQGDSGNITIYVATFPDHKQARMAYEKMIVKITPFNTIFSGGLYTRIQGKEVYRLDGGIDDHFLFVKEKQVFWLAVQASTPDIVVKEYIEYIF